MSISQPHSLGLPAKENSHIYFQSENYKMRNLAFELGREANFSEVSAIYGFTGETHISHMESVMAQSADILHPQLEEFGGPKRSSSLWAQTKILTSTHPRPCLSHEKIPGGAERRLHQHPGESGQSGSNACG